MMVNFVYVNNELLLLLSLMRIFVFIFLDFFKQFLDPDDKQNDVKNLLTVAQQLKKLEQGNLKYKKIFISFKLSKMKINFVDSAGSSGGS